MKINQFGKTIWPWLIWRTGLLLVFVLAIGWLAYKPSFAGPEYLEQFNFPDWMRAWANFDGVHYLTVADKGYVGTGLIQAFFPVFPIMIKTLSWLGVNSLLAGLLISNLSFVLVLILWCKLLKLEKISSNLGLGVLLLFPTAFFFGVLYNESLFLLLTLGSFLAMRQKRWWLAAALAGLASGTRLVGVFLWPALIYEWLTNRGDKREWIDATVKNWLILSMLSILSIAGLLGFMVYLWREFGDPLYFFHVQSQFGAGRQEALISYPQVVWRYIKILLTARPFDLRYLVYIQEFLAGIGGLGLLLYGWKKVRGSYLIFALPAFLLPTLTGTFSSLPRYLIVLFPIHLVLAQVLADRPRLRWVWLVVSAGLLVINTMLFLRGYWVG